MNQSPLKRKALKLALIAAAAAAVSLPLIGGRLNAQQQQQQQQQQQKGTSAQNTPAPAAQQPAQGQPAAAPAPAGQPTAAAPAAPAKVDLSKVDPNKVILKAGGAQMTAGELNDLLKALPEQQREQVLSQPGALRMAATEIAQAKALAKEAEGRKLHERPEFKTLMGFARDQVLGQLLVQDIAKTVGEEDLKKFYEQNKAQFPEQVEARHILIRTPGSKVPLRPGQKEMTDEQAKAKVDDIRNRLTKGEDFAAIAKAESDDAGSGAQGGSLGAFPKGMMVPEFDQVAFTLKEGEVSQPVKTQFGWHLIQVQDRLTSFEDYREQLQAQALPQKVQQFVQDFRAKTKPELDESVFGPEPVAPAPPTLPGQPQQGQPGQPGPGTPPPAPPAPGK